MSYRRDWMGGVTRQPEGDLMTTKTGQLSGAALAALTVLALVGLWTGWTSDIAAWAGGHLGDAISGWVERQMK